MKVLLMVWIVIGGVDRQSLEACKAKEAELLAQPVPAGTDFVSVGGVIERRPDRPA